MKKLILITTLIIVSSSMFFAFATLAGYEIEVSIPGGSTSGEEVNLTRTIDIPLNTNPLANETKTFKFRFTYDGTAVYEQSLTQNVSFINLQKCDGTYTVKALNFTFFNEINQTTINATANPTSFESSWKYWIGTGSIQKNYSFQNLSSTLNNNQFCIYPYVPTNFTFRADSNIAFTAVNFRESLYYLKNATLTNVQSNISLYLLYSTEANKFFLTFLYGTSPVSNGIITVQKFFTGQGTYNTVAILQTDTDGKTTMWKQLDKTYKYFVVKDGTLLGTAERVATCAIAPCSLTILIEIPSVTPTDVIYEYFAENIESTLRYNKTTKMVIYEFIDTTGLTNYFRLHVQKVQLNQTGETICDTQSFSTAGTITCNMTGLIGEYKATTYISRSPELVDKILGIITSEEIIDILGPMGVFLVMALLITIVFAGAIVGRGSPSVVLWFLAGGILGLKLIGLFPFTWIVVVTLEVIIFFIISQVKN